MPRSIAAFVRLGGSVPKVEAIRVQGGYSLGSGVVVGAHKERARAVLARLESMSADFAGRLARLLEPG